jgi:hypothetical protein
MLTTLKRDKSHCGMAELAVIRLILPICSVAWSSG